MTGLYSFPIHVKGEPLFPTFNKPAVVGCFSVDSERKHCSSNLQNLKYIHVPANTTVNFDLNRGADTTIRKIASSQDEKLDNVLQWIIMNKSKISLYNEETNTHCLTLDFVCFRGLLTVLMCTPYEQQDGWIICATKWKNTIYLCAKETTNKRKQREEASDKQKRFMSWGYKFEQYMATDTLGSLPSLDSVLDENEEFCVTFQTKLGNHRLLYGAEIDGVTSDKPILGEEDLKSTELLELKTSRKISSRNQFFNFKKFKLIKWWCQSFLVGITTIICGFRDDRGTVHQLQEYKVAQLPKMAESWNACRCMMFLNQFLSHIKDVVVQDDPDTVFKFEWEPGDLRVTVSKIVGPSELSFLPKWYTDGLF